MGRQSNLYRRGASYVWRRRLPARLGGTILQISLRTNDPLQARRLGASVTAESYHVFEHMTAHGLSREDARACLERVITGGMRNHAILQPEPRRRANTTPPIALPPVDDTSVSLYDPGWSALVERFAALKAQQKISDQTITQMGKVFQLFAEATGITDIRNLRQTHIARFVDVLRVLPKSYRKSPRDKGKSLQQILAEAQAKPVREPGLSDATIHRNLNYIGQIVTKGASEGYHSLTLIDISSLRPRKSQRDRDVRVAYTEADVQAIFRHPVWQGRSRRNSWDQPGEVIVPDGLYWLPVIAALTGARRAEIAGLMPDEIALVDGVPTIRIKPNKIRGLKTLASTRDVPLHPQLVDLGLLEQAQRLVAEGAGMLFADQRTPKNVKLGDKIDYKFRRIKEQQLGGPSERKSFHSFRHYVTTRLTHMGTVPERVIKDILGHTGDSVTTERYSATTPLTVKAEAIRQLPWLPVVRPNHRLSRQIARTR